MDWNQALDGVYIKLVSLVFGFLGALGGIILSHEFLRNITLSRYFFALKGERVTLILANDTYAEQPQHHTADIKLGSVSGTGLGQVIGAAAAAKTVARLYGSRRKTVTKFSKLLQGKSTDDLVLLGGPKKNGHSRLFLEKLRKAFPDLDVEFEDRGDLVDLYVKLKGEIFPIRGNSRDYTEFALVVFWRNPFYGPTRRAILCCGLTGFGTEAAALWTFEDAIFFKDDTIFFSNPTLAWLKPLWPVIFKKRVDAMKNSIYLLEVSVVDKQLRGVEVVGRYALNAQ